MGERAKSDWHDSKKRQTEGTLQCRDTEGASGSESALRQ